MLFSMIASCKLNDVEPWSWMRDVLRRLPDIPMRRMAELLPDRWQASREAETAQGSD